MIEQFCPTRSLTQVIIAEGDRRAFQQFHLISLFHESVTLKLGLCILKRFTEVMRVQVMADRIDLQVPSRPGSDSSTRTSFMLP